MKKGKLRTNVLYKERYVMKTTPYEIMDYWNNTKSDYGNIWILDPGEITCMACGAFYGDYPTWLEEHKSKKSTSLQQFWNSQKGLQRCHIIADAAGGEDKPENLLLLCRLCHDTMPKINDRDIVLKWCVLQPKQRLDDMLSAGRDVFSMYDITDDTTQAIIIFLSGDECFHNRIRRYSNATAHFPQVGVGYSRKSMWFDRLADACRYYKDHTEEVIKHYESNG